MWTVNIRLNRPIILFYLLPLCEELKGLVHSLYFSHFNPQIKRRLNGIKLLLLTFGMNWIYEEHTHSTTNLRRQNTLCLIFHLLEDNNVKKVFNKTSNHDVMSMWPVLFLKVLYVLSIDEIRLFVLFYHVLRSPKQL